MDIKSLREWINKLPKEFDDFNIVYRKCEYFLSDDKEHERYWTALDNSIVMVGINEDDTEMFLCDKDSADIMEEQTKED